MCTTVQSMREIGRWRGATVGFHLFSGSISSSLGLKEKCRIFVNALCLQYVSLCFSFYTASSSPFIEMLHLKCIFSALFYPTFHGCSLPSVGRLLWTCLSGVQEKVSPLVKALFCRSGQSSREKTGRCVVFVLSCFVFVFV